MLFRIISFLFLVVFSFSVQSAEDYYVLDINKLSSEIKKTETFTLSSTIKNKSFYSYGPGLDLNDSYSTNTNEWNDRWLGVSKNSPFNKNIPSIVYIAGYGLVFEIDIIYNVKDNKPLANELKNTYKKLLADNGYKRESDFFNFLSLKESYIKDNSIIEIMYRLGNFYIKINNKDFLDNKDNLENPKYKAVLL